MGLTSSRLKRGESASLPQSSTSSQTNSGRLTSGQKVTSQRSATGNTAARFAISNTHQSRLLKFKPDSIAVKTTSSIVTPQQIVSTTEVMRAAKLSMELAYNLLGCDWDILGFPFTTVAFLEKGSDGDLKVEFKHVVKSGREDNSTHATWQWWTGREIPFVHAGTRENYARFIRDCFCMKEDFSKDPSKAAQLVELLNDEDIKESFTKAPKETAELLADKVTKVIQKHFNNLWADSVKKYMDKLREEDPEKAAKYFLLIVKLTQVLGSTIANSSYRGIVALKNEIEQFYEGMPEAYEGNQPPKELEGFAGLGGTFDRVSNTPLMTWAIVQSIIITDAAYPGYMETLLNYLGENVSPNGGGILGNFIIADANTRII